MSRFIVTGATGIIGSNLCKFLVNNGNEVVAIIRKNSNRVGNLIKNEKLKIVECNLDELCILDLPIDEYDTFFHLAWDGSGAKYRNNVDTQVKNIHYTMDAVKLAKKIGCKCFIGTGSQAEYGRANGIITSNTKENPDNGYGIAKLCAGQMSRLLANQIGIKHIWTRIFSVYGPNDADSTMVSSSINQMLVKNESPEYTPGGQDWDFLYVEDCVRALYLLSQKGINNKLYNVAYGKTRKLYEFIELIRDNINSEISLKLGARPYSENQVMNLAVDISDLKNDVGFIPKVDFEEGIKRTIDWYKERM